MLEKIMLTLLVSSIFSNILIVSVLLCLVCKCPGWLRKLCSQFWWVPSSQTFWSYQFYNAYFLSAQGDWEYYAHSFGEFHLLKHSDFINSIKVLTLYILKNIVSLWYIAMFKQVYPHSENSSRNIFNFWLTILFKS